MYTKKQLINKIFHACVKNNKLVPDYWWLKMKYFLLTGEKLNLSAPKTFNEKLMWLNLYYWNPKSTKLLVDKYEVKKWVVERLGKEYVIPTLGIYNCFDEIDFDLLPERFVLKCTHDSGSVLIVNDKKKFDMDLARVKLSQALKMNYYWWARERIYKDVKPRIIAEEYMQDRNSDELEDYKFFCFNGVPKFLYISEGLDGPHEEAKISYVTMDWKMAPFYRRDYLQFEELPPPPASFDKMREIASRLAKGLPFVRVDLYEINGEVYFSEMTLSPGGGLTKFYPERFNRQIGAMLKLPQRRCRR